MSISFEVDIPENQGVSSSAIGGFIDACEAQNLQVSTFMLIAGGKAVAQFWKRPYEKDCVQLLYSLTKSFTAAGVGIASDKGLLSLDDPVISFFPDKLPACISNNLRNMRVKHLLSMTCGIHDNTYGELYPHADWVKAFLAQDFPHEPGTYFRYSTHASHMLSAIVHKAAGENFYDFLKEHLFAPLGIEQSTWEFCGQGIAAGGMGLGLTTESIAKFGQMLLSKGVFGGTRVLSEAYVDAMTAMQADESVTEKDDGHRLGYGYQMKIGRDAGYNHAGGFGTLLFVAPKRSMVVAVTSRKKNYAEVMDLIHEKLVDAPVASPKEGSAHEHALLREKIDALAYAVPSFSPVPDNACALEGTYEISDNPHGLYRAAFTKDAEGGFSLRLRYHDREDSHLRFHFARPVEGNDVFVKDIQFHRQRYVSYASWSSPRALGMTVIYLETPYVVTYAATFSGDMIELTFAMNVSLNLKNFSAKGRRMV